MCEWQPIETCLMTPGSEMVIRLKNPRSLKSDSFWLGRSVHQIGRLDAEGDLWSHGRKINLDDIEGYIFIPAN